MESKLIDWHPADIMLDYVKEGHQWLPSHAETD